MRRGHGPGCAAALPWPAGQPAPARRRALGVQSLLKDNDLSKVWAAAEFVLVPVQWAMALEIAHAAIGAAGDGKGSYYFIETAEKVVGAFADCLGGLLSVAAQNVVVEVKASAGRIARVRREGATRVDDRTWTVPLGDVFEEEQRDVLVEVELLGSQNVEVSFGLRYVDATSGRVANATATASVAVDAAKAQTATPNAHVTEQRARLDTADALLSARECADRRDIAGARRVLESQKAKIAALKVAAVTGGLVERLAHDLAVVLEGLANEDAYRARGRQWMTSKMMGHQMQRCMEDSDSDEEEGMPRLTGSTVRARNVYRNTSKKSSKVAMMRGMSAMSEPTGSAIPSGGSVCTSVLPSASRTTQYISSSAEPVLTSNLYLHGAERGQ